MNRLRDWILFLALYMGATTYGAIYLLTLFTKSRNGSESDVGLLLGVAGIASLVLVGGTASLARKFGAHRVCSAGVILLSLGFGALVLCERAGLAYYAIGLLLGTGWSLFYAAGPMIVLNGIPEAEKGRYINHISVCTVVGTATLPVLTGWLPQASASVETVFKIAAALIGPVSVVLILVAGRLFHCRPMPQTKEERKTGSAALRQILRSEARYPLFMVFLGGAMFSALMNFQTSYAVDRGFSFSTFYFVYMIAVIGGRLLFGGMLVSNRPMSHTPILLSIVAAGLLIMVFNRSHELLYAAGAALIGLGYGLSYPLIKTYALKNTAQDLQLEVVAYFALFYFAGVYFYPVIAGFAVEHGGPDALVLSVLVLCIIDLLIGLSRRMRARAIQPAA